MSVICPQLHSFSAAIANSIRGLARCRLLIRLWSVVVSVQADVLLRSNQTLKEFLEDNPEQLEDRNMSLADLKHTFSLVSCRAPGTPGGGGALVARGVRRMVEQLLAPEGPVEGQ